MSDFLNKLTILDEVIEFLAEKNNISLDETYNSKIEEVFNDNTLFEVNWEKEAAKLDGPEDVNLPDASEDAVEDFVKASAGGKAEPSPKAPQMIQSAESGFVKSMKDHGLVGTAAKPLIGVVDKGLKFLFGSGVFNDPRDANPLMMQINQNPYLAPYYLSAQLALLGRAAGDSTLGQQASNLAQGMEDAGDSVADSSGAAGGDAGGVEGDGAGSAFAVPVFKKFSGKDQKAGAPARSLASQMAKIFPDVPKSAVSQILKDLAKQLKAQDINIQENKNIISKNLLSHMISEGRLARGEVTADEVEGLRAGELLKKTDAILKSLKSTDDVKRFKASVEAGKAPEGLDSKLNRGAALKIQNYYTNHGGKDLLDTKLSEKPAKSSGLDKFKETLKTLDLDTPEGRAAAANSEESYLGAYRFYKAMKLAAGGLQTSLTKGKGFSQDKAARIDKLLDPLNERNEEYLNNYLDWLKEHIKYFEQAGLDKAERAMKASRSARGAKEPEKAGPGDTGLHKGGTRDTGNVKKGQVNARQSVAPQLKAAGIDLKSPQGRKLHKKMLKVIRRFLSKNMQRLDKQDIKVVSENLLRVLLENGTINEIRTKR
jgi:hypothetical protein